ncbi:hypothetical protein ACFWXK_09165 [Streptomyces sp. NPDC059070]|uniref:hypothetical protein n=1 Tax=unclassified Streptomyces TaxID=2593676 RepID=UPI0034E21EEA
MRAAVRSLLVLTVLLAGASAVTAHGGPVADGGTAPRQVVELMDTSWGDDYVRPES